MKNLFSKCWSHIVRLYGHWSGRIKRFEMIARLRKADIVLASPRTIRLSPIALMYRLILRSQYVHSMLYIGDGNIIHTTTRHGVVVGKLPRRIYKKDRYSIFRVNNLRSEKRDQVVEEALKWKDKKLDHAGLITTIPSRLLGFQKALISWEKNRIWCSKLVYQAFFAAGIELVPPEKAGVITSEDLANLSNVKKI